MRSASGRGVLGVGRGKETDRDIQDTLKEGYSDISDTLKRCGDLGAPKKELLSKGEMHNEIEYKQISRDDAAEKH